MSKRKYFSGQVIKGMTLIRRVNVKNRFGGTSKAWEVRMPWGETAIKRTSVFPGMRAITRYDENKAFKYCFAFQKARASRRGLAWELDYEDFERITSSNCHYCDSKPGNRVTAKRKRMYEYVYNGIDRRDNDKGYTLENSVPCCGDCNRIKNSILSEQEMILVMRTLRKYRNSKLAA